MSMDDVMQTFNKKQSDKMTVLEFLRTADENEIVKFIHGILFNCECYGDCPLTKVSDFNMTDGFNGFYACNRDECIMKFLESEVNYK